jgi:hypothetical protein
MGQSQDPSQPSRKPNPYNSYLKYSSLALQLFLVIGVFGWLGYKIDRWLSLRFPVFLLLLGISSFGAMMYQVYRSINRP